MSKRKPGRPDVFTPRQNITLRAALRDLRESGGLSQEGVGAMLGVSQQTASKLLNTGGFSYATATALARALGHATIDAFFAARKSAPSTADLPAAKAS